MVAEAAFQDRLWRPGLAPLLPLARIRIVHCTVSPEAARVSSRRLHSVGRREADDDAQLIMRRDGLRIIARNPCHIDGAGKEESDEREIVPLPVVFEIAKDVPMRYRALVLLAAFANMRWAICAPGARQPRPDRGR